MICFTRKKGFLIVDRAKDVTMMAGVGDDEDGNISTDLIRKFEGGNISLLKDAEALMKVKRVFKILTL